MNFADRFKGKTSIMTKEGLPALVRSSQVPIHKSPSPEPTPSDTSRHSPFLASISASQNNTHRHLPFPHKKTIPKHPTTWPPSDNTPKLMPIHTHRPALTQSNTPLTGREVRVPSWNGQGSVSELDSASTVQALVPHGGFSRNGKTGYNDYMPSVQLIEEKMPPGRAQSTIRERVTATEDYFDTKIRPSLGEVDKKLGRKNLGSQRQGYSRASPLMMGSGETVIHTENQEVYRQGSYSGRSGNIQANNNILRRSASSHRELIDREISSGLKARPPVYPKQAHRTEESVIEKLVEENVVKYMNSLYGLMLHNPSNNVSASELELKQKSVSVTEKDNSRQLDSTTRMPGSARQMLHETNGRIRKMETSVISRNRDIIDQLRLRSEDRPRRSNSHEPFLRSQLRGGMRDVSPFTKMERRRIVEVENS